MASKSMLVAVALLAASDTAISSDAIAQPLEGLTPTAKVIMTGSAWTYLQLKDGDCVMQMSEVLKEALATLPPNAKNWGQMPTPPDKAAALNKLKTQCDELADAKDMAWNDFTEACTYYEAAPKQRASDDTTVIGMATNLCKQRLQTAARHPTLEDLLGPPPPDTPPK